MITKIYKQFIGGSWQIGKAFSLAFNSGAYQSRSLLEK